MNISFIGFGKIAQSLVSGWLHMKGLHFFASAPSLKKAITAGGIETTPHNLEVTTQANVIILAVKPAQMESVLAEIHDAIPCDCLLISVATGLKLAWFAKHTPPKTAVIRAMPNIAAAVRQSATPLIKNQYVREQHIEIAQGLFNTIGITTWLQRESDIDIFTALSGSGPAYIFQLTQAMVTAAINMGLDQKTAADFALQTVSGAAAIATQSQRTLQALIEQVSSKGGTTEAALRVFQNLGFSQLIETAMQAAQNRAKELDYT